MNSGYKAPRALSYRTVEDHAAWFRTRLGLPLDQPLPAGIQLFERLGDLQIRVDGRTIEVAPHVEPIPREGLTRYREDPERFEVVLREDTYERLEGSDDPRARFTVFHEIGHLVEHPRLLLQMSEIPHAERALMRGRTEHAAFYDTEWQANAFAGALLIPAAGLRKLPSHALVPWQIATDYRCSQQCATIRLELYRKHF
jgi:hypothetical protein